MIPSGAQLGMGVGGPGRGRGGVNPSPEDLGEGGSSKYRPLNASAQRDLGWRIRGFDFGFLALRLLDFAFLGSNSMGFL